ncbi:MAG: GIY-YIG nuclease family protein [Bacteroidota bacterium]
MGTYYVYVIYSESTDAFYIGQSVDFEIRVHQHNVHENEHSNTNKADDWVLFWDIQE